MLETHTNNSFVIYEIPGHKVGMCKINNYPFRPISQVNKLKGRPRGTVVQHYDFRALQYLEELTWLEVENVEAEWQDKLGYLTDNDKRMVRGKTLVVSDETRAKLSAANMGHRVSDEAKAKIGSANRGRTHTKETKARMSAVKMGKVFSEEHKAKIGDAHRGRKRTEEAKAKMSAAKKGKPLSEEHRAKLSIAQKKRRHKNKEGDVYGNKE